MKVIHKKDCTVLRILKNECAVYYGVQDGKTAIGFLGSEDQDGIQKIDAALRGVALMLANDPEFVRTMADIYEEYATEGMKAGVQ